MLLPLAYYGDQVLRKKSVRIDEINDELRQLVLDMVETMRAHNGMGLAAVQVSKPIAMFITQQPVFNPETKQWEDGPLKVYINPRLVDPSKEICEESEGCLSLPGIRGNVARPVSITVEATDLEGNRFTEHLTGYEARCIMHENDHLNGILYIDRITGKQRQLMEPVLTKIKKKHKK